MSDSAIVAAPKSFVQSFIERARGVTQQAAPAHTAMSYVKAAGATAANFASGGAVGALLGAAHGKFGLDTKGGPIDGWLSGISAIASIGLAGKFPAWAAVAERAGSQAFAILAFRKGYGVVKHAPLAGGSGPTVQRVAVASKGATVAGEDPIEKAAKGI